MRYSWSRRIGVLGLAALVSSACSNPERDKLRHVERGNQYAAQHRDEFAAVEYASAIKIDPRYGDAHLKLAETYERMGNLRDAVPEFTRAADAMPGNRDVQLKATQMLLLSGRFEDAKARAAALLDKNQNDADALLLHADAMVALRDPQGALTEVEEALKISPDSGRAFVALGAVRMQSGEAKAAEEAFRRAIALEPASIDARLALASFLWSAQRVPEAEAAIKDALAIDPQHVLANRMLGVLCLASGRPKDAEQPLKIVADVSKAPAAQLQLADYYAGIGRTADAVKLLTPLASSQTTLVDAESRLAALDYAAGRKDEAHKRLDGILARVPNSAPVLVTKAQWLIAENELDAALTSAKAAVAADPQSASAHFVLATTHDRRMETADAANEYREVLRLNPRATAAQVALSRLSLAAGDRTEALRQAEAAKLSAPSNLEAKVTLARSLIAAGNLTRADAEVNELLEAAPQSPVVQAVNGALLASRNNAAAARAAFERALRASPGFLEALGGLTYLDLQTKNPAAAIARLDADLRRQPGRPQVLALLARAALAAGDAARAEQALRQAIAVDPRFTPAYAMLAQLYLKQGRLDQARAEYEGIGQRNPSDVGARTMVGSLLEVQGKRDEAVKAYQVVVNSGGNAPVAANNLAFIYAERGTNLDEALQLATQAKQRMPDDASVDDTLGWIYYKKGQPQLAIGPLQDSLKKRSDNAEVLYHLGMTQAKLGQNAEARVSLQRALKLDPKIGGDDARRMLDELSK
jgi:tetratricopeptide (TPR) repeat protein